MGTAVGMRAELHKRAMAKSHAQHHPILAREDIYGRFLKKKTFSKLYEHMRQQDEVILGERNRNSKFADKH